MKVKQMTPVVSGILKILAILGSILILLSLLITVYSFLRGLRTNHREQELREYVVETAESYLGCNEADGSHRQIIDTYNTQDPLPRGYKLSYEDSWCAAFVSVVMMDAGLEDWVPTECSCQELIALMEKPGDWEESDWYIPQIGDFVFYAWDHRCIGDCHCWADHVGIVAGVYGPIIKVIEGNKDDTVAYRYIWIGHPEIRGYGLPYYHKMAACGVTPENAAEEANDQEPDQYLVVATNLPDSPAITEDWVYAYDLEGNLCLVRKPTGDNLPSYDASDRLVEDMTILVSIESKEPVSDSGQYPGGRDVKFIIHSDLMQKVYTPMPGGEITGGGQWFLATVGEVAGDTLSVYPRTDVGEFEIRTPLVVEDTCGHALTPGDTVLVAYDGTIDSGKITNPYCLIPDTDEWLTFSSVGLGVVICDIDNDGTDELCGMGYGPTSGLFTFTLTVWENGLVEYSNCYCIHHCQLSFVKNEDGTVQIRAEGNLTENDTQYLDIQVEDGQIWVTENGEPVSRWSH